MNKCQCILLTLVLGSITLLPAQHPKPYHLTNYPRFLSRYYFPLVNPFAGGLHTPQFSNYDFNRDSIPDLFVFDAYDNKVLTFINRGNKEGADFEYAPQYESFFPALGNKALLVDYNKDGKEDIFAYSTDWGAAFEVYKNVSDTGEIRFQLITEQLKAQYPYYEGSIYVGRIDVPAIVDVDNDGDVDILSWGILGGFVEYYKNMAVEDSMSLDSLRFYWTDGCWGQFKETGTAAEMGVTLFMTGDYRCDYQYREHQKKHAASSTITAFDMDGDGDRDILMGDGSNNNIIYLENGKVDEQHPVDSMLGFTKEFPRNTRPVDINRLPAGFFVHAGHDTLKDLIFSPQANDTFQNTGQVWYYKNTGNGTKHQFTFKNDALLQDQMVDLGSGAAPVFFDLDKDGDQDLLVATHGNFEETFNKADRIVVFERLNTDTPAFKRSLSDFLDLSQEKIRGMAPAFGDPDMDGDLDLVLGNATGKLIYYENTAPPGDPPAFQKVTGNYQNIDVGSHSAPFFADLNRDSLPDLVVGNYQGLVYYYQNQGSAGTPEYKRITTNVAGRKNDTSYAAPVIADLDLDGKLDMVVGEKRDVMPNKSNTLHFYYDIESHIHDTLEPVDTLIYDELRDSGIAKYLGNGLMPSVALLDQDSLPDIMLGNSRGGLIFLGSFDQARDTIDLKVKSKTKGVPPEFSVYPNPAKNKATIEVNGNHKFTGLEVKIYTLPGKNVLAKNLKLHNNRASISLNNLQGGLYILTIKGTSQGIFETRKLQIYR